MESAFAWLASWVSAESNGNGGQNVVRISEVKDIVTREVKEKLGNLERWRMGTAASFVRLAGVSGALAIGFGAYGAHGIRENPNVPRERVLAFDSGNRYHIIHSVALLAAPLSKYPTLTGTLFSIGIVLFSGTCYYFAMTGRGEVRRLTPFGGLVLMLAWLSFVL